MSCSGSRPSGRGPIVSAGGGDWPLREAHPGPEGRGFRVLRGASSGATPKKREATLPEGPSSTPTPSWASSEPFPRPWGLTLKNSFCSHRQPIS